MSKEVKISILSDKIIQDAIDRVVEEAKEISFHKVSEPWASCKIVEIGGEAGGIVGNPQLYMKVLFS